MTMRAPPSTGDDDSQQSLREQLEADLDMEPGELQPFAYNDMTLQGGGEGGDDRNFAYSRILAQVVIELGINDLASFMRAYIPDDNKAKMLIQGLMDLGDKELAADCCRRELRLKEARDNAKYWSDLVPGEQTEQKTHAEELISRWSRANVILTTIRRRRLTMGIEAVWGERAYWYTALRKQQMVDTEAAHLPAAVYQYYLAKLEEFKIQRENEEDRAQGKPTHDHSKLITRLRDGVSKTGEIATQAPWAMVHAVRFALQNPGDKNPFWKHQREMFNGPGGGGGSGAIRRRITSRRRQADMAAAQQGGNQQDFS